MNDSGFFHPIRVVALKTGLSPHLIRVWERRYGAVTPGRTDSQRRVYSEGEIERLKLLQMLTEAGHSIGSVATLDIGALRALCANSGAGVSIGAGQRNNERQELGRQFVGRGLASVTSLDHAGLDLALQEAAVALGQQGALLHVVAPLTEEVGLQWQRGEISIAHEHFASSILRTFLGNLSRPYAGSDAAPVILMATPTGQLHELGAMLTAAAAASMGWRATYVGASLGAHEIAGAVKQMNARAVALSVVYPTDDPGVADQLRELRRLLPVDVALLIGGRAAPGYRGVLDAIEAVFRGGTLAEFMECLATLREPNRA